MLNCVPYVLKCPTCLKSYFALRTLVHHVFRDVLALLPHMLRVLRAHVPYVLRAVRAVVPHVLSSFVHEKIQNQIKNQYL